MTDNLKDLAAGFAAAKAHRTSGGANSVQLNKVKSVAALIAAKRLGAQVPKGDVVQYNSCVAMVEFVEPVSGTMEGQLMINDRGGLWKGGPKSSQLIERALAAITEEDLAAAEKLLETVQ